MIESAAYDIIKNEGFTEGIREGMKKGEQDGLRKGLEKGRKEGRREGRQEGRHEGQLQGRIEGVIESIGVILEVKFGIKGIMIHGQLEHIQDLNKLKKIIEVIKLASSPEDVTAYIESV